MKILRSAFLVILGLLACGRAMAADPEPREPLTPKQIEELVSPIALYPDPLVALILPAATQPSDIVLAARFLESGGDPERAVNEPWDESVKALVRYREVVDYLDENLAWTRRLGECFLEQPADVMNAIQAIRARARVAGLLKDTSEQEIIVESDEIRIVPANPTVIYVPRYDPEVLYVSSYPSYYPGPFLTFGIGYGIGAWLSYDCDWRYHSVRIAHRPAHWYHQPDWRGRYANHPAGPTTWRRWAPPSRHDRRFDRPSPNSRLAPHPGRPPGLPGPSPYVAPSTSPRATVRPGTGPGPVRPESPRRVGVWNQPRDDRMSPRRESPVAMTPPAASPAPARVSPQRIHHEASAAPRREHSNPPSDRPVRNYTPPAPRVTAPSPERSQPVVQSRPAESPSEGRSRPAHGQRAERNEPRRQEN